MRSCQCVSVCAYAYLSALANEAAFACVNILQKYSWHSLYLRLIITVYIPYHIYHPPSVRPSVCPSIHLSLYLYSHLHCVRYVHVLWIFLSVCYEHQIQPLSVSWEDGRDDTEISPMKNLYSSAKFFIIFLWCCLLHIRLSCLIELYLYPLCFYVATSISLQTTLSSQHAETVARLTATQQQLTSTRQELASSRQDVTRLEETVQVECVVKHVFGWTWWRSTAWCGILTKLCTTNSILSSGLVYLSIWLAHAVLLVSTSWCIILRTDIVVRHWL